MERTQVKPALWIRLRIFALQLYYTPFIRWLTAALILGSFLCDALQTQMIPKAADRLELYDDDTIRVREDLFNKFELAFTIIFTFEIAWNFFGHGFVLFFSDGWNLFDSIVVLISVTSLFLHGSNVKSLRLLRVSSLRLPFIVVRASNSLSFFAPLRPASVWHCFSAFDNAKHLCAEMCVLHSDFLPAMLWSLFLPHTLHHLCSLTLSFARFHF